MRRHAAQDAGAEVAPLEPAGVGVDPLVKRAERGRADPLVPVHARRDRFGGLPLACAVDPALPTVRLVDVADRAGLEILAQPAQALEGVTLVAHLGDHLVLAGRLGEDPGLVNVVYQRLFAVDVLAELDRPHRGAGVVVVDGDHEDGIDLLVDFVEHATVVEVRLRLRDVELGGRKRLDRSRGAAFVGVRHGDEPLRGRSGQMRPAATPAADHGEAELGVGRGLRQECGHAKGVRSRRGPRKGRGSLEQVTTRNTCSHRRSPCRLRPHAAAAVTAACHGV